MFKLLREDELLDAEVLGKAMRFGAMFSVGDPRRAGRLVWQPATRMLELQLTEDGRGLFGEVAEARFNSLAQALKAQTTLGVIANAAV